MTSPAHRLDITFTIEWLGTWHVGSGFGTPQADRLILRRGGRDGVPFVPGSQLKGVLRHQAERLLASLLSNPTINDPHAAGSHQIPHFVPLSRSASLIDRLFGSRYQGDCLFVRDALPTPGTSVTATRFPARTAMDRLTGTVREHHLFVTEVAEGSIDSLRLHGHVRARHPAGVLLPHDGFPVEYALLVAALGSIEWLGGDKSLGQGHCRIGLENGARLRWECGNSARDLAIADALRDFATDDWSTLVPLYEEERGTT